MVKKKSIGGSAGGLKSKKATPIENLTILLNKKYGLNSFKSLKDIIANKSDVDSFLPTGILSVDYVLGGGLPVGRLIEVFGNPGSGKTSLSLQIASYWQKKFKYNIAIIDLERSYNLDYYKSLGLEPELTHRVQPELMTAECCLSMVYDIIENGLIKLIILDSVANLIPACELEDKMDVTSSKYATLARILSKVLKKIVVALDNNQVSLIAINQLRSKMGGIGIVNDITPGGKAMKFLSYTRLELKHRGLIRASDGNVSGSNVQLRTVKNRLFEPYVSRIVEMHYGKGFDFLNDIVRWAIELGVVIKNGAWYVFQDKSYYKSKLLRYLQENPQTQKKFIDQVVENMKIQRSAISARIDASNYAACAPEHTSKADAEILAE